MHVVDRRHRFSDLGISGLSKHSVLNRCPVALPGLLVIAVGLVCLTGCYRSRLFSPAGEGREPHLPPTFFGVAPGSSSESGANSIRISQDAAVPETEIQPVPQRLAKAQMASGPDTADAQIASMKQPSPDRGRRNNASSQSQSTDSPSTDSGSPPQISGGTAGVDLQALEEALQDAPPEVRELAIRRFLAVAKQRAARSPHPQAIDDAMADSLGSLPELPDEVIDDGRTPTRLASAAAAQDHRGFHDSRSTEPQRQAVSQTAETSPTDLKMVATQPQQPSVEMESGSESEQAGGTVMRLSDQISDSEVQPAAATQSSTTDAANPPVARALLQEPIVAEVASQQSAESIDPSGDTPVLSEAELFDALLARLAAPAEGETDAEKYRRQIMRRHLMVLAGEPDRAVDQLEGLTNEEQEYLRHQLLGLWTIIDPKGHPVASRRLSSALPQIREATRHLAAASDSLEVRSLEFCTEIEAYGQIKPFPDRDFKKGQEVILYCEIENFLAKSVDGGYETVLQGSYEVLDESGARVASQTLPVDRQLARNPLRDYFIAYQMHLPRTLDRGNYRLRLTMEDVHGRKYGQADVKFRITE